MHGIHQHRNIFRIYMRMDPMTQVKNMPVTPAIGRRHPGGFLTDNIRVRIQHRRIQIALYGHSSAHQFSYPAAIDGPIDADGIKARTGDSLNPQTAAFAEQDYGNTLAAVLPIQTSSDLFHVSQ